MRSLGRALFLCEFQVEQEEMRENQRERMSQRDHAVFSTKNKNECLTDTLFTWNQGENDTNRTKS